MGQTANRDYGKFNTESVGDIIRDAPHIAVETLRQFI